MAARRKKAKQDTDVSRQAVGDHAALATAAGVTAIAVAQAMADDASAAAAQHADARPPALPDSVADARTSGGASDGAIREADAPPPSPDAASAGLPRQEAGSQNVDVPVAAGQAADAAAVPASSGGSAPPETAAAGGGKEVPSTSAEASPGTAAEPAASVPAGAANTPLAATAPAADGAAVLADTIATQVSSAVEKVFAGVQSGIDPENIAREISQDIADVVRSLDGLAPQLASTIGDAVPDPAALAGAIDTKVATALEELPDLSQLQATVTESVAGATSSLSGEVKALVAEALPPIASGGTAPGIELPEAAAIDAALLPATLLGAEVEPVAKGLLAELFYDDGGAAPAAEAIEPATPIEIALPLPALSAEKLPLSETPAEIVAPTIDLAGLSYLEAGGAIYEGMHSGKDFLGL